MKKKLLLLILLLFPLYAVFPKPLFSKPIHVDPYSIVDIYKPSPALLFYYDEYLRYLIGRRYFNASRILEVLRGAGGPSQILTLINRTISVARDILELMRDVEVDFDKAEKAILEKKMSLAEEYLIGARRKLYDIKESIGEFEKGLNDLTHSLGVSTGFLALRLKALKERYEELEAHYTELVFLAKGGRLGTSISLHIEPNPISVGDKVKVYGFLKTENGTFLGGREVTITIDERFKKTMVTNSSGFYFLEEEIWIYKEEIEVTATYSPKVEEMLAPCMNSTNLNITFIRSMISVKTRPAATPGSVIKIGIRVSPVGDGRDLDLIFDNMKIASINVENSSISLEYSIPEDIAPGIHVIEAYLKPKGLYSPAYSKTTIAVNLLPIDVSVDIPQTVIYPLTTLKIYGVVTSNNTPIREANITLYRNGVMIASTLTGDDGSFLLASDYLNWLPIVETTYRLTVNPQSSKLSSYSFETVVKEVNLIPFITVIFAIFLFIKTGLPSLLMGRFRRLFTFSTEISVSLRKISDVMKERAGEVKEAVTRRIGVLGRSRVAVMAKYKGKIGLVYWIYLNILTRFSIVFTPIRKSETFREYLRRIARRLRESTLMALARLTILAEAERYGGRKMNVEEAEELAEEILDELEQ